MIRTINKVALYARFSSDNQRTESIDAQIRAMKDYCKKKKFVIVNTYIDEARSAMNDRRPSFQQMIADSDKREFNIVLVHKLDRFARSRYDSAIYKKALKKNGVMVYSVLENIDDSPESIMMESIIEGMAEYYSRNLGREVMKGMKETALKCCYTGGNVPLGFDIHPSTRKFIINEHEAETVRIIFRMFVNGYSYSAIVNKLREEKRLTKRGEDFKKTSLYSILTNMKYKGVYVFNKSSSKGTDGTRNTHLYKDESEMVIIEGGCPQIVSREQFDRVQAKLSSRSRGKATSKSSKHYMLSGIGVLKCANCGAEMRGNSRDKGKTIYICPNHKDKKCPTKELLTTNVDEMVANLLANDLYNRKDYKKISKAMNDNRAEYKMAEKKLKDLLRAKENIIKAIEKSYADELIDRLEKIKKDETTARRELAAL